MSKEKKGKYAQVENKEVHKVDQGVGMILTKLGPGSFSLGSSRATLLLDSNVAKKIYCSGQNRYQNWCTKKIYDTLYEFF